MTVPKKRGGRAKGYFPKVAEARKAIAEDAVWWKDFYKQVAIEALAAQEFITAEKVAAFMLTHMPEDEETGTLLNTDIDKNKEPDVKGGGGPSIQIGVALGGMNNQKALPEVTHVEVVDVVRESE